MVIQMVIAAIMVALRSGIQRSMLGTPLMFGEGLML